MPETVYDEKMTEGKNFLENYLICIIFVIAKHY